MLLNPINPIHEPPIQHPFLPARPPHPSPRNTSQVRRRHPPQVPPSPKVQPSTRQGHVGGQRRVEGEVRDGRDRSVSTAARRCSASCKTGRLVLGLALCMGMRQGAGGLGFAKDGGRRALVGCKKEGRKERKKRAMGHLSLEARRDPCAVGTETGV